MSLFRQLVSAMLGLVCLGLLGDWLLWKMWLFRPLTRGLVLSSIALAPGFAAAAYAIWRKVPKYAASLALDHQLGGGDLVTSAWSFAQKTPRSALEELVLRRALERLRATKLGVMLPIRLQMADGFLLCAFVALAVFAFATPRRVSERVIPLNSGTAPSPNAAGTDGAAQMRALLTGGDSNMPADSEEVARPLLQLVDAWERGEVDRTAVAESLALWEARLHAKAPSIRVEITQLGRVLSQHRSTHQLGAALTAVSLDDARRALDALEHRWREPRTRLSASELQSLRQAVEAERVSRQRAHGEASEFSQLNTTYQQLQKKRLAGQLSDAELRSLQTLSRRLERLEERGTGAERIAPALTALDRAILEAAEALRADLQAEPSAFDSARAELTHLDALLRSEAQKLALLDKIRQLRELLRRQEPHRASRLATLERYGQRAAPPSRQRLDVGVVPIPLRDPPTVAERRGSPVEPPGTSGEMGRNGPAPGSGDEHVAALRGQPPSSQWRTQRDAAAASGESGAGTVSAEVVSAAGVRGFARPEYAAVFRAYEPIAESALARPDLPFSDKTRVRRYFQLISPRESRP